jgi:dCMP deaminase
LFDKHADADEVLLLGESFADDFPVLHKEIRALSPDVAARYLVGSGRFASVRVVQRDTLTAALVGDVVVAPDEELMRALLASFPAPGEIVWERTFLRWDRSWSLVGKPPSYDGRISVSELDRELMLRAAAEAGLSSDWWRQVGALAVRDGEVLGIAHNAHRPTEYSPYLNGDPRNDYSRGVHMELSTAIHAEATLVGQAARAGVALAGADLYVSTFPCPACARLVAEAGFRRCFFAGPYAVLDGDDVLRAAGVELIWVDLAGT